MHKTVREIAAGRNFAAASGRSGSGRGMLRTMRAALLSKLHGSLSAWLATLLVMSLLTLSACTGVGGGGGDEEAIGNNPPRITSLSFTVARGATLNGQLVATDLDGGPLVFAVIASTTNGTLAVQPSGAFTYTPNANFTGPDTFVARVTDPPGAATSATVTITVTAPVNRAPTLTTTTFTVQAGMTLNGQLIGVDPEGGAVTFAVVTTTANGTLVLQPTGAFTYTPNAGFTGPDPFTVRLTDPQGTAFTGTVTITVTAAPNTPPTLTSTAFTVVSDRPYNGQLTATDLENNLPITFARESNPANGTVTVAADGTFTYTPNAAFVGTDTFQVRVTDALGASSVGTVTMTVTANRAPVAVDDEFTYPTGSEVTLPVTDNDSDPDNDPLTVEIQGTPFGGTATVVGGTSIRFQLPVPNFQGFVRAQYLVRDPGGIASNIATAVAFVGTPPFQIAWLGDEFTAGTNELALADLLVPPRRVNGPLASGSVDRFIVADNASTFAYTVGNRQAFFATAAALGTGNPLYGPIVAPSQHVRTTVSADGARICSTYFDSGGAGTFRSFVFATASPCAGTTVATTNHPICFEFSPAGSDLLFLGQSAAVGTDPAIYRATAAAPSTQTRLTRPTGFYTDGGWQTDQVFVAPDFSRVLFRQTRASNNLRAVYELTIANPQNESLLSEEFTGFGRPVASRDRNRITFATATASPEIYGYDRVAPQSRVTLYPGGPNLAPTIPVFANDGSRVAFVEQDLANFGTPPVLCDTAFVGPFGCTSLLTGYFINSTGLQYDANGSSILFAGLQTSGDFRLLELPRNTPGVPTTLSPNALFTPPSHQFAQTDDSAVIAVALRATATGPLQVYLINRAVPGEALLISNAGAASIAASSIRFVAR